MATHDERAAAADDETLPESEMPLQHLDEEEPDAAEPTATVVRTPGQRVTAWVRKHWILTLIGLAVLGIAALVAYVFALQGQLVASQDPTAASTENISRQLPKANTTDAVAPTPTESMDQKAQAEKNIMPTQAGLSADSLNAQNATAVATNSPAPPVMPIDTAGQAQAAHLKELKRKQHINRTSLAREAHRRNVDTVTVTERNPHTGAYESRTKTVQRSAPSTGRPKRDAKLPLYAPDGVPYEDNEEVNRMLAAAPPQARDVYEQMTGHRYRPVQQRPTADQVKNVLAATPGMDGFFTVKLRKADGTAAEEKPVDVFFKCQINGAQRVVSGSVVALRLTEDAVLDGRTFPKNLIFAGVAQVGSNNVNIQIERLGPARVACQ
ncbi:MAG: conjugative transposon protein TraM, partial [Cytophagaceae bacterium]